MSFRAYRFLTRRNANRGLTHLSNGMVVLPASKAVRTGIDQIHKWSKSQIEGDLVMMGHWNEIASELATSGRLGAESTIDAAATGPQGHVDVMSEFDDMWGALPGDDEAQRLLTRIMPIYISASMGADWSESAQGFTVVADPRGEMVKLVAGRAAGVVGGMGSTPSGAAGIALTAAGAAKDLFGMVAPYVVDGYKAKKQAKLERQWDATEITVSIGLTPSGKSYRNTGKTTVDQNEILLITLDLMKELHTGVVSGRR